MDPKNIISSASSNTTTPSNLGSSLGGANANSLLQGKKEGASPLNQVANKNSQDGIELPNKKSSDEGVEKLDDFGGDIQNQVDEVKENPEVEEDTGPKPGDKVDTGKQLNENGEVEDSSTKKTLKAVGRGAAAYFSGGSTIGKDSQVVNAAPVDKTIGVVSDQLEKVPGVKEISKELDEAGIADGVNDALDAVGAAKNGDIGGVIESAKKLNKDKKKLNKKTKKMLLVLIIPLLSSVFSLLLFFGIIAGPILGGFMDVVESEDVNPAQIGEIEYDWEFGFDDQQQSANIAGSVENFENLSDSRQKIIQAAATAVATEIPYSYGSHPNGPGVRGVPSAGLDCAGFVQWALWTGLGGNPGYLTTKAISDRIGKDFIQISKSELLPGDIGLKRTGGSSEDNYNHTGIYAGNDFWFHASSGKKTHKVVKSKYTDFTIYLRYVGVE